MSSTGVERWYASNSGHWHNSVCMSYPQRLQGWKMANRDLSLAVTLNEHTCPIIAGTVWFYPDVIG
jgi:hypothetical protein